MARIPDDIIERIREATDIVELVAEHVQLTRRGRNFFGLCPFHGEKTPSFSVNPERQIYHCFGCGAGGNAFKFVQEVDRVSFVEAVAFLARRAGILLPDQAPSRRTEQDHDLLYRANELARKYFHHLLLNDASGQEALEYLRSRGLAQATLERFGLGYAPHGWDELLKVAGKRGLSPAIMEQAGLALPRQGNGGHYDRFRDRIAFPIANLSGRTIAFGARGLKPDQEPKYLNSPETPVYRKGGVLYGLDQTRQAIRQQGLALVVEGYMDLLSLVQSGIEHAVASAGTALTEEQCRLLGRYAPKVVLVFDGDAAGSAAAQRGLEVLLGTGLEARVVSLPPEHDPDSLVQREGPQAMLRAVEKAESALDFYLKHLSRQHDLSTLEGKARASQVLKPLLARPTDAVRRDLMLREAARRLGVDEEAMRQEVGQQLRRQRPVSRILPVGPPPSGPPDPPQREKAFLGLLLNYPRFIGPTAQELTPEAFADSRAQQVARLLFGRHRDAQTLDIAELLSQVEDQAMGQFISSCALEGFDEAHLEENWRSSLLHFQIGEMTGKIATLEKALNLAAEAGDGEAARKLSLEHQDLVQKRRDLAAQQNP
jgi:DNA primase